MKLEKITNTNKIEVKLNEYVATKQENEEVIICSMAYQFAKKLPYSMDYCDEDFVPGDFINLDSTAKKNQIFKYYDSVYSRMIDWGDSRKSAILLQVCFIFQKMLLNEFPNDYTLNDEDYYNLGIDSMTQNEDYNKSFFQILKQLPKYYKKMSLISNQLERRKFIYDMYTDIQNSIGQKIGGFKRTDIFADTIVTTETKPSINWSPVRDLEMVYYFDGINEYGANCNQLINEIKIKENNLKELQQPAQKKLT